MKNINIINTTVKDKKLFKLSSWHLSHNYNPLTKILGQKVFYYPIFFVELKNEELGGDLRGNIDKVGNPEDILYIWNGVIYKMSNKNVLLVDKYKSDEYKKGFNFKIHKFIGKGSIYKGRFFTFFVILSLKVQIFYKYVVTKIT